MRLSIIIVLISIINPLITYSQCLMAPLSLSKRVVNASTIVQGKVIKSTPYLSSGNRIYTSNIVEVNAYLKGYLPLERVIVISEGGVLEDWAEVVEPSLDLDMQHEVVLMLLEDNYEIDNKKFRSIYPGVPQLEAYGCTQGKLIYQDGLYHDLLSETPMSEATLFRKIQAISGLPALTSKGAFYKPREQPLESFEYTNSGGIKIMAITSATPNPGIAGTINVADQITISGSGFGATVGTVEFFNADDGGATYITSPVPTTDIISWSDAQIVMKVPSQAGTGLIRVNNTFTTAYTVSYSHIEINSINVGFASSTRQRFYLVNKNGSGGYTFQYNTAFATNLPAVAAFERALASWRCNTFVNFNVSATSTSNSVASNDGINTVFFDATLPAGVLGQALSFFSGSSNGGCTLQNTEWFTSDIDIRFAPIPAAGCTWNYGPSASVAFGLTYDFESVALHELGHAHGLGHVISTGSVMHWALFNGADARTLNSGSDIAGGLAKMAYSTVAANYCIKYPAGVTGPMVALTGSNCALPVTLLSFTGKRIGAGHNLLEWVTDTETENAGFELQRSTDGINYFTIGHIQPKGGSRRIYYYDDYVTGESQTAYYKLIQIDLNGNLVSFPIVVIEALEINTVSMFVEPGDKMLYTIFSKPLDEELDLFLYNATGQLVAKNEISKNSYQSVLSIAHLASGVYSYSVIGNKSNIRGKVVIQQIW